MMLMGPSDMYGDMALEDVDEFEGLEPDDAREISPEGRFQRDEVRSFEQDFEFEMEQALEERDYVWQEEQDEEIEEEADEGPEAN